MRLLDKFGAAVNYFRGWSAAKQDIAIITIAYFLSQGALLFLTGKWVDDWNPYWDDEILREMAYRYGQGEPFIWLKKLSYVLPGNGYLFLIFFFYYMASLSLYWILLSVNNIPRWDRIWLVLFFAVLPVNDARAMNICFPYGFCYGVFYFAFFLLTHLFSINNIFLHWLIRICTLMVFIASFPTNSLLVFYAIPLAYIWYRDDKRGISFLWRYADFLVIPLAFWIIKKSLWPAYGFYADYYKVGILGMARAGVYVFPESLAVLGRIFFAIVNPIVFWGICVWGLFKLYQCFICEMPHTINNRKGMITGIIIGLIVLNIGIFPYLVIGNPVIYIAAFEGRNALLVPLGAAFVFYYGIKLCPVEEKMRHVVCAMVVLMSIGKMNHRYMDYQEWAYQQMAIGEHMRHSSEIRDGQNFLWVHLGARHRCDFWSMAGISREVFGDEKRLFLTQHELHAKYWFQEGVGENTLTSRHHNLGQYDLKNQKIDGVILYQYSGISKRMLLGLKFDEMFRPQRFLERISSLGYMDYIPAGGFVINDKDMPTMWSEKGAADISQRSPKPMLPPR